jgi:hypothetical protein
VSDEECVAVDTLEILVALTVRPADEQERSQVDALCQQAQQATGHTVKLPDANKGFVLLPRFRRLSRDFERMPEVLAGLHFVVFALRMLPKAAMFVAAGASS